MSPLPYEVVVRGGVVEIYRGGLPFARLETGDKLAAQWAAEQVQLAYNFGLQDNPKEPSPSRFIPAVKISPR